MKPLAEPCSEHQKKSPAEMMASEAVPAGNTGEVGEEM